eukprot:SAG11_NODE_1814_length_4218_cov_2.964797_4_plen_83_part_00
MQNAWVVKYSCARSEDGDLDGQATKEDAITSRLHQAATKAACHATLISLSSCGTVSAAIGAACQADMLDMVVVVDGARPRRL